VVGTEEGERELCAAFGIEFRASVIWKAAVAVPMAITAEARLPRPDVWRTPKSMLEGLVEF
jgi:hypothetical protein